MGMFNDINDAMGQVGDLLNSPAMTSVDKMKNASTSLNVTANLDPFVLEQGFPGHGNAFYQQMQEVQNLSDAMDECGNFAQDLIQASTEDYIKNTGIQQAGRDLADTLGQFSDEIDCAAGFATLFDSKGIIDDVLGIGDLPQIQSRVQQIVLDATDPSKLANMITNLDAVQGLLEPFNDFCTGMKDALNLLVAKDLAALNAILNKLAQFSAFANLATSDPCALVNNNKMFSSITDPVMDDILDLYDGVVGGNIGGAISDVFAPDISTALVGGRSSGFTQAPGTALPFQNYFSTLGTPVAGVVTSIATVVGNVDFSSDDSSLPAVPMVWNGSEWVDDVSSNVLKGLDSIAAGVENQTNSFNSSLTNFLKTKNDVEFAAVKQSSSDIYYEVASCSGGVGNTEDDCLDSGGNWNLTEFTKYDETTKIKTPDGNVQTVKVSKNVATSAVETPWAKGGSGADVVDVPSRIIGKPKMVLKENNSNNTSVSKPANVLPPASSSPEGTSVGMFPTSSKSEAFVTAAKIQRPDQTSSFESSITQFDQNKNILNKAKLTGDYSKVTACKCVGANVLSNMDENECVANRGTWVCQTGSNDSALTTHAIPEIDTINTTKNVNLKSVLPTNAPFGGI